MPDVTTSLATLGTGGYTVSSDPKYRGSPNAAQVMSPQQIARGANAAVGYSKQRGGAAALIDVEGKPLTRLNSSAGLIRRSSAEHSIWWPLHSSANRYQNPVFDFTGTLRGKCKGSGNRWGCNLGMTFNGTNQQVECNDSDSNAPQYSSAVMPPIEGFTNAVKACADWSSLYSRGDMIIAWAVLSHPVGGLAADGALFSFGLANDPLGKGFWDLGIKSGAAGKVRMRHRGQGASAIDAQDASAGGVTGNVNTNSRTAIAVEIVAATSRYIDVSVTVLTLDVDGGNAQNNVGFLNFDMLANSGTAACGPDITGPMILGADGDAIPCSKLTNAGAIGTGSANQLTLSADFGAAGPAGSTVAYTSGIYIWFGSQATTPALTPKYYWCVFSTVRIATIYSNGPGSAAINFSAGVGAISVPAASYLNRFAGATAQIGVERRARDLGIGPRLVRDLRGDPVGFPLCLE